MSESENRDDPPQVDTDESPQPVSGNPAELPNDQQEDTEQQPEQQDTEQQPEQQDPEQQQEQQDTEQQQEQQDTEQQPEQQDTAQQPEQQDTEQQPEQQDTEQQQEQQDTEQQPEQQDPEQQREQQDTEQQQEQQDSEQPPDEPLETPLDRIPDQQQTSDGPQQSEEGVDDEDRATTHETEQDEESRHPRAETIPGKSGSQDWTESLRDLPQATDDAQNLPSDSRSVATPPVESPSSGILAARTGGKHHRRAETPSNEGTVSRGRHLPRDYPNSSVNTLPPLARPVDNTPHVPASTTFRKLHSAKQIPIRAQSAARETTGISGTLTPLQNVFRMTTRQEYDVFRVKNGVHSSYKGPVHVVEDMHVTCASCGGPVDPVTRVPAGKLFFHPLCIHCCLCGRSSLTDVFFQAMGPYVVCSDCSVRGFTRSVPKELSSQRGMVLGACRGSILEEVRRHDHVHRDTQMSRASTGSVVPPTLVMGPLHNRRNTSRGSLELIQRQRYYTQNDNNVLYLSPAAPLPGSSQMQQRRIRQNGEL